MNNSIINICLMCFFLGFISTKIDLFRVMSNFTKVFFTIFIVPNTRKFRIMKMIYIISTSNPFKIFYSIISFIKIFMINLWKIIRIWNKSFSNNSMNRYKFSIQFYNTITPICSLWFKKFFRTNRINMSIRMDDIIGIKWFFHNTNILKIN